LLGISGRSRKPQIALAKELGLNDYPCAAGGCLLTDPAFARRVKDLKEHGPFDMRNIELLKVGRHFRLSPQAKLIVGRDERENNYLLRVARPDDRIFKTVDVPGPVALSRGALSVEQIEFSARAVSFYSDLDGRESTRISHVTGLGEQILVDVKPALDIELDQFRI
jgi:hypothetical protein